jgi:hypothetical protein
MMLKKIVTTSCGFIIVLFLSCVIATAEESTFALPPALFLPELVLNNDRTPPSSDRVRLKKSYRRFSEEKFTYEYEGRQRRLADFFADAEVRSFLISARSPDTRG